MPLLHGLIAATEAGRLDVTLARGLIGNFPISDCQCHLGYALNILFDESWNTFGEIIVIKKYCGRLKENEHGFVEG